MEKLLFVVSLLFLQSCILPDPKHENGKFLGEVVPLTEFNSEYDDYNSNIAQNKWGEMFLTFSSKRDRKDKFNLVTFPASLTYDKHLELKKFSSGEYTSHLARVVNMIPSANGNFNVYGPRLLSFSYDLISHGKTDDLILFYADDSEGDMDVKYLTHDGNQIQGPFKFNILNSAKDDAYPSFSHSGDKIYFSSNREGNFDIYEVSIPRTESERITIESLVNPKTYEVRKVEELSTPYDDKCPYFWDDMMVFVSDRPGGFGGQDIYYSRLENGKWSAPINPGDRINTQFNEYRPILPRLNNFNYRLMLFSSDRPGGKGGFDLYMTGLVDGF